MLMRRFVIFAVLAFATASLASAADGFKISPETEKEQLAILRSDAPAGEKAIACKKLAIDGSSESVPELAKLLSNPQLASWSRIALEAIPGAASDEALRKAAESLDGNLLVGVLNSIGVRRDAGSVEALTKRVSDKDDDVASAAAVALGKIGNDAAVKAIRPLLTSGPAKVRSAAAEGCVLAAERLDASGKSADAVALYDEVRKAELPKQRIVEATRGAILARKADGIPLLLEQLRSNDRKLLEVGLFVAREFPGNKVDQALADELAKADPNRAALIILAMADRKETVVVAAISKAATSGPKPVRLAAIKSLSQVGDASSLDALLSTAVDADEDLALAAKATLADLPGDKVNSQIAAALPNAKGKTYSLLIELAGQRRIEAATPALLKAVDSSDQKIRQAALLALGETVSLKNLSVLISQAVNTKNADDAATAQQALKTASVRMPDREACAAELATALDKAPAASKALLLDILGDVGGEKALKTLATASKSNDPLLQDNGTKVLGKWGGLDGAPVLLDLAKSGPANFRIRTLRGYVGMIRKFPMPDAQRAEMCQKALDLAKQDAEQKLVLDVTRIHPSPDTLAIAIKLMKTPALKDDATQTTLVIAQKLGAKGINVAEQLGKAGFEKMKVEIVKAEYGSGATQKDVTAVVAKQATDLPLISLPAETYNASFGGDPTPGAVKQLKVQYKINGKAAEATFAENALIVLPMPK